MSSLIATTLSASNPVLCLGFLDFFPYPDSLASTMAIDFLVGIAQAACLILPMYGFAASFGRFAFCPAPADTVDLIHIPLFLHGFSRRMLLLPLVMSPFASQVMMMKDVPAFDASTFNNMLDRVQSIAKALDEDLPRSPVLSHPCEEVHCSQRSHVAFRAKSCHEHCHNGYCCRSRDYFATPRLPAAFSPFPDSLCATIFPPLLAPFLPSFPSALKCA